MGMYQKTVIAYGISKGIKFSKVIMESSSEKYHSMYTASDGGIVRVSLPIFTIMRDLEKAYMVAFKIGCVMTLDETKKKSKFLYHEPEAWNHAEEILRELGIPLKVGDNDLFEKTKQYSLLCKEITSLHPRLRRFVADSLLGWIFDFARRCFKSFAAVLLIGVAFEFGMFGGYPTLGATDLWGIFAALCVVILPFSLACAYFDVRRFKEKVMAEDGGPNFWKMEGKSV